MTNLKGILQNNLNDEKNFSLALSGNEIHDVLQFVVFAKTLIRAMHEQEHSQGMTASDEKAETLITTADTLLEALYDALETAASPGPHEIH